MIITITDGWAARTTRDAMKAQAKKSIVSLDARVGPVPTLITMVMMVAMMVMMVMMVMMMVATMVMMEMMKMFRTITTFFSIAAPRLCTVL